MLPMTDASKRTLIPSWEGFLVPVLRVAEDGVPHRNRALVDAAIDHVGLDVEARAEELSSGDSRAANRAGWAMSFLTRAGALERPRRGEYVITDIGRRLLADHPDELSVRHLEALPAWQEYEPLRRETNGGSATSTSASTSSPPSPTSSPADPQEVIQAGVDAVHEFVAADLLQRLRSRSPEFLEQAVLDVLVAMGYGGTRGRSVRLGRTNDGGIDGVIEQDPLGLENIYVQAKRYADGNTVGRPELQGFVGALHGLGADRGVFITTSRFSSGAEEYARSINSRIVLIDGQRLVDLMIRYGVGVQTRQTYQVVEVDEDYFE
jgi:restriction system protein